MEASGIQQSMPSHRRYVSSLWEKGMYFSGVRKQLRNRHILNESVSFQAEIALLCICFRVVSAHRNITDSIADVSEFLMKQFHRVS